MSRLKLSRIYWRGLVLPDGSFEPTRAFAYAELVFAIRFFLEEDGSRGRWSGARGQGGGGGGSAELAIPLSWHRKSQE